MHISKFETFDIIGIALSPSIWGGHHLSVKDRLDGTFPTTTAALGITSLRYPGGSDVERYFDMTNPDASEHIIYGELTPLSEFLWYCNEQGIQPILQVPTKRFRDDTALGAQQFSEFLQRLSAGEFGEYQDLIIEIGNEFHVVHEPLLEEIGWGDITAEEYGDIAVAYIQEFSALELSNIEIAVQGAINSDANRTVIEAFRGTGLADEIDHISIHAYPRTLETIEQRIGSRSNRVESWEQEFGIEYRFFLSEWNIKSYGDIFEHPDNAWGLRQAFAMVELVYQLAFHEVDLANVWTQQQATVAGLSWIEGTGGLRIGGHAYRMLSGSLHNAVAIETGNSIGENLAYRVFETEGTYVVFITAFELDEPLSVSFSSEAFQASVGSAWVEVLTSDAPENSPIADPIVYKSHSDNLDDTVVSTTLVVSDELHKIVFFKKNKPLEFWGTNANDVLASSRFADVVYGDLGSDEFRLKGGDDFSRGGVGEDRIDGGTGNDTLFGDRDRDFLQGRQGNDIAFGGAGRDLIIGGDGKDILIGGKGGDVLRGGHGSDIIYGGRGNDGLRGSFGEDQFIFGQFDGDDRVFDFEVGYDSIVILEGHVSQVVQSLSDGFLTIGFGETSIRLDGVDQTIEIIESQNLEVDWNHFLQFEALDPEIVVSGQYSVYREDYGFTVTRGTIRDDTLVADQKFGLLLGKSGNDLLYGGGHGDILKGGQGDDTVRGRSGDDTIYAGRGNDIVFGGAGDDTIYAGSGDDVLFGQEGADTFVFGGGQGHNIISDYVDTEDTILFDLDVSDATNIFQRVGQNGSLFVEIGEQFSLEISGYSHSLDLL